MPEVLDGSVQLDGTEEVVSAEETAVIGESEEDAGEEAGSDAEQSEGENETPEQKQKRLSGGQRQKIRRIKAEQERDFWKQQFLERSSTERAAPAATVSQGVVGFPDIDTFPGSTEEFKKAQKQAEEQIRQAARLQARQELALEALNEKLGAVEDMPDLVHAASAAGLPPQLSQQLADFVKLQATALKNGADVIRELFTDDENRDELFASAKAMDAAGIAMLMRSVSRELRRSATTKSATEKPKTAEVVQTRAPKPPTPVSKPSSTDNGELRDDLPTDEWMKRRNAQIEKRNS